jgi:hypothetical protein
MFQILYHESPFAAGVSFHRAGVTYWTRWAASLASLTTNLPFMESGFHAP